ncbi:hypothetical protein G5T42_09425 [Microbacterium sp. 4R-513]|uniref:hypothetical protein n=1 Tax=Microbacterium sp. 4R-513 TaxID=2567934 RepID=UPI0013E18AB0|nr:hypothetical protein [Microbacterium sp. 4R-513]QIG39676.1 hypothetical protein G5T42_09425 [Microbacterium sp. 4R-513]
MQHDAAITDGWVSGIPQAKNAAGTGGGTDVGQVEGDVPTQGADPDLAADADTEEEQ